ncbi:DinB family protein [Neobacillus sp. Marseille-QA0830]
MNAILQFGNIIPFLEEIKERENDQAFFQPISEGKWSTAAIVAHLLYWDQYILNTRLPSMITMDVLPSGHIDVQAMNHVAETYAHSGIGKSELIDSFLTNRKKLLDELNRVNLQKAFTIGSHQLTIESYILDMAEHDLHHINQIKDSYTKKLFRFK